MIVVAPVLAVRVVLGRFLQVKFQSVQNTDRVEPFPWLAEREADLLVVRDRALKIVDKELWSERCHTRLHRAHRSLGSLLQQANVMLRRAAITFDDALHLLRPLELELAHMRKKP